MRSICRLSPGLLGLGRYWEEWGMGTVGLSIPLSIFPSVDSVSMKRKSHGN